jgi:predicted nucleotidyltransferase
MMRPSSVKKRDIEIAREMKETLSKQFTIFDFRLFGSRAKGNAMWDSDLDLYIEVEALDPNQRRLIHDLAWEIGSRSDIVISPIVITRNQLENTPFRATPIYQVIKQEGIMI